MGRGMVSSRSTGAPAELEQAGGGGMCETVRGTEAGATAAERHLSLVLSAKESCQRAQGRQWQGGGGWVLGLEHQSTCVQVWRTTGQG